MEQNEHCKSCQYGYKETSGSSVYRCSYLLETGKMRGCSVPKCEHWKDPKRESKRPKFNRERLRGTVYDNR